MRVTDILTVAGFCQSRINQKKKKEEEEALKPA